MISVLIAEDSPTIRALLSQAFAEDSEVVVVGSARNGQEAVDMTAKLRPDVITMDIRMPVMDGFEATRQIMSTVPTPIVIISGCEDVDEISFSMQALRMGALSVLPKPAGPGSPSFQDDCLRILTTVKTMSRVKVAQRRIVARSADVAVPPRKTVVVAAPRQERISLVGVVASTGGPPALQALLGGLPADFEPAILIVQHMATGFIAGFASWLGETTGRSVTLAVEGAAIAPGTIHVGAEDFHLTLSSRTSIRLTRTPPDGGFRPSGSVLLRSVADHYGAAAAGVVLTGMGADGTDGLGRIKACGGYAIAQDRETSVVFGMPRAAEEAGHVDELLAIQDIPVRLAHLARKGA